MTRIIIIGGVAGGMSAATRLRRLMEDTDIVIYEKGPYVSFANCGLPYHLSGEITERDDLIVQSPQALRDRFNLTVKPNHDVISVNPEQQTVVVRHGEQEIIDNYDILILSPGAHPIKPLIQGLESANNVYTLRNIPDLDRIMAHISQTTIKEAVVIGAGFIGLEMAENLKHKGFNVTVVEMAPQVLPPFDSEMAGFVQETLLSNGINVITSQSVVAFKDQGKTLVLSNDQEIYSDLTILSAGVQPSTDFIKDSGITLGQRNGIIVDESYRTNYPNVYAVGDATLTHHQISKKLSLFL